MALKPNDVTNFATLQAAGHNGDLALLQGTDAATGDYRAIICAVTRLADGGVTLVPFGHMVADPFTEYSKPEGATLEDHGPAGEG